MIRKIVSLLVIVSFLAPRHVFATECKNRFPQGSQFQLVEQLKCNGITTPVKLQITNVNVTANVASPFLAPGCDGSSVYFNLNDGSEIVDFSDTVANALAQTLFVSRACDGKRLFQINRKPEMYSLPNGNKINTSVRVSASNAEGTLIAYAIPDEDIVTLLTLRDANGAIIASASKALMNNSGDPDRCAGIWTVNNVSGTQEVATIISYLLTLKDNAAFNCDVTNAPQGSPMSAGAVILGVAIGAILVAAGGIGIACYCSKTNPRYAKMKLLN